MEAAKEKDLDTVKTPEVQKVGKVMLPKKNPGKELVPLLILLSKANLPHLAGTEALGLLIEAVGQTLGEGVDHPEEKGAD